jgi:hypothetical protein
VKLWRLKHGIFVFGVIPRPISFVGIACYHSKHGIIIHLIEKIQTRILSLTALIVENGTNLVSYTVNKSMKTKLITPKEVAGQKLDSIPDEVIDTFNELIVKGYHDGVSIVYQKKVVKLVCESLNIPFSIFNIKWLKLRRGNILMPLERH